MAITLSTDMILGIGALIVALIAIVMFLRATQTVNRKKENGPESPKPIVVDVKPRNVRLPDLPTITERNQVEQARTQIRTLTLKQEILSMVMKRLFEAEDNEEISREERIRLSKNYEDEMQQATDELKKAELIISLNELEEIRTNIIDQFQQTLTETQSQIDLIIRELNIKQPEPEIEPEPETKPKRIPPRRRPRPPPVEEPEEEYEEELLEEEEDEEGPEAKGRRETVEDRLDKLKQDVLKELEELERLELEQ
jgi:hypothetical protein